MLAKQEPCAWHSSPSSEMKEEESHGICERCAMRIDIESTRRQVNKLPSYIERFSNKKWDKYAKEAR